MKDKWLRGKIARDAARLIFQGEEQEFFRAKRKAARELGFRFQNRDLPSNREIAHKLETLKSLVGRPASLPTARRVAIEALRWLRRWQSFDARLVWPLQPPGSAEVMFELHLQCSDDVVRRDLESERLDYSTDSERSDKPILVLGAIPIRVVCHATSTKSGFTAEQLEAHLLQTYPGIDIEAELLGMAGNDARHEMIELLLDMMADVPSADAPAHDMLEHAIAFFEIALADRPYDEELLTAALFHEIGEFADPGGEDIFELLQGFVTPRTMWLIEQLHQNGNPSVAAEDRSDLRLLKELHKQSLKSNSASRTPREVIEYLKQLDEEYESLR